jgi:hypothetical protein
LDYLNKAVSKNCSRSNIPEVPCLLNRGLASSNASRSLEQTASSEASAQSVIPSQKVDKSTQLTPSIHLKDKRVKFNPLWCGFIDTFAHIIYSYSTRCSEDREFFDKHVCHYMRIGLVKKRKVLPNDDFRRCLSCVLFERAVIKFGFVFLLLAALEGVACN